MGWRVGVDQVSAGQERRRAALGGAAQRQPLLGRGQPALRRVGPPPRLPYLLRQSRAHHVEVP